MVVTAVIVCVALLRSAVDWSQTSLGCGPAHEHASCSWSASVPLGFCERGSCREAPSSDVNRSDRYDSTQVRAINRRLDLRGQRARFREATEKLTQVDLVITWLNSTDATWRDAVKRFKPSDPDGSPLFNPNGDDLSDTFMELKYSLRSYEQHGLLAR